mgnify:CR=1 FL=1
MPTVIDTLVVKLGIESAEFKKGSEEARDGMKKTREDADKTGKEMEASGKKAASFFGSIRTELLALVGVTLSAQGIKAFITSMTSDLMRLGIESRALDMSAKSLDGWERAASAAGSTAQKMSSTLAGFQNALTNYRTGGAQDDPLFGALANFGAATGANFDFNNDSSGDIMRKVAQNWNKLSEDAKRRFGGMLGFDSATQQGLSSGSLVRDADNFAKISRATEDATKKALEFNRRLEEMKQNFSAAAQVLYEALIPYVEKLIPLIERVGIWIAENGPAIEKKFQYIATQVNSIVEAFGGWETVLQALLLFMAGKWLVGITGALGGVKNALLAISRISLIAGLVELQKYAEGLEKKYGWLVHNPVTDALNSGVGASYFDNAGKKLSGWMRENIGFGFRSDDGAKSTGSGQKLLDSLGDTFRQLESQFSLPAGLLRSVANTESAGNPNAVSSAGAQGLFQFMPGTANDLGIGGGGAFDPMKSAKAAARYLRQLLDQTGGNLAEALGAYNWGIGNVQKKGLDAAPEETRNYIPRVLSGLQVGAGSSASRYSPSSMMTGSPTEINIQNMTVQSSATSVNHLGADVQRNVSRSNIVSSFSSGQG